MDKIILHCDLNNFYASVEQLLHIELRNRAIAVAGNPKSRHGIVLAKSNEAKAFGIKTGDTVHEARAKCPNIIFVPPTYAEYVKYSKLARDMYSDYTDKVEPFGPDECWLDVTGSKIIGTGEEIADELRYRMRTELGLTISVGVSFTKAFAKLGSDIKKPDATTIITRANYKQVVWTLPTSDMIMIGRKTTKKLHTLNINTIGDLANSPNELLQQHFGKIGTMLLNQSRGIEFSDVLYCYYEHVPKSISNGTTTSKDMLTYDDATSLIYILSDLVAYRLRQYRLYARGVSITLKTNKLISNSIQCKLPYPTDSSNVFAIQCVKLLIANHNISNEPLRAITIGVYGLANNNVAIQYSLFDNPDEKISDLDTSIDKLKEKYGYNVIKRGVYLDNDNLRSLHTDDGFKPF